MILALGSTGGPEWGKISAVFLLNLLTLACIVLGFALALLLAGTGWDWEGESKGKERESKVGTGNGRKEKRIS